jgi:hypothetical protein
MVHAMAFDPARVPRVACCLAAIAAGCGSPFKLPPQPPAEPEPIAPMEHQRVPPPQSGRNVVVGEMCPKGLGGRPGVAPLIMRAVQWIDQAADLANAVERGSVPRFVVYGIDGKPAGVFDTLGLADIGLPQPIASGAYTGASPCSGSPNVVVKPGGESVPTRTDDPRCVAAIGGCGLAIAELVRPDDPIETPTFPVGGACLSGDSIAVDIDGDGIAESFPLSGALDGIRGPAAEWTAQPVAGAACTPTFQLYDLTLAPEPDPGKSVDIKSIVKMDLLGVVDLDGDGRKELIFAMRFALVRTVVIYSAVGSPGRLVLVGEATSFPR